MKSKQVYFEDNKITCKYDPNLDPMVIDCPKDMFDSLMSSNQLDQYLDAIIPSGESLVAHKRQAIRKLSDSNPGCALVYVMDEDFVSYPSLLDILLPLVKDKRVKLVTNATGLYDRFIFTNPKLVKFFAENARYRISDLGGDLSITNKAIFLEYLSHLSEKYSDIRPLNSIVPLNKEQAAEFIAKHTTVILKPLFDVCSSYGKRILTSVEQVYVPYDNNADWDEYMYTEDTDANCPFMLQELAAGEKFIATGYVAHGLDLGYNPITFASCPDEVREQVINIITGAGLSSTFFTFSGIVNNGIVFPTNIDLCVPKDYLGEGELSLTESTIAFAAVFNVTLRD